MERKEKFQCPNCGTKLPFMFVVKIKNDHEFNCPSCGASLVPEKTKSFTWGYIIGLLAFLVPFNVMLYFEDDFLLALLVGTVCGLTAIFLVSVYVYSNIRLTKSI